VTYLASLQPWRSIAFEVGQIALLAMTVLLVVNLFAG
jgi:hypothetical protein